MAAAHGLLIYDGGCAFCTTSALRIAAHWTQPATAVAWQQLGADRLAAWGLSVDDAAGAAWWIGADGTPYRGHDAIAQALRAAPGWRRVLGVVIGARALRWLAAPAYRTVATHRHLLPGATDACKL